MFSGTELRSPTDHSGGARSFVKRLARWCPTISPRARAWLLAAFLAANLVLVLLPAARADRLGLIDPAAAWIGQLEANREGTAANTYSAVIWGGVAVLAVTQVIRSPSRRRWLQRLGWLSMALIAALIACEEGISLIHKDRAAHLNFAAVSPYLNLTAGVPPAAQWLVVALPLLTIPLLAAGWVLVTSQLGHPARALLTGLAAALAAASIAVDTGVLHVGSIGWEYLLEEGLEIMAAALFVVILVETLGQRVAPVTGRAARHGVNLLVAILGVVLLAANAYVLVTRSGVIEDSRGVDRPWSYTGPIALVEQRFRASHNYLHRIEIWTYVDVAPGSAEIFARLTPEGSERPIRESRALVDARRFSNATVAFDFEPIPASEGKVYKLTVGVLSGPTPYVFVGLARGDAIPEGTAIVSGAPTPHMDDLAVRTASIGRLGEALLFKILSIWR